MELDFKELIRIVDSEIRKAKADFQETGTKYDEGRYDALCDLHDKIYEVACAGMETAEEGLAREEYEATKVMQKAYGGPYEIHD